MPAGGVTADVLRLIKTQPLYDAIAQDGGFDAVLAWKGIDPDGDFLAMRRPGRRGRDDTFYAAWAARYVAVCATTRRPYAVLVRDHPDHSERTIRDFVHKARSRGLLLGGSAGRSGGRLSAKAERLLGDVKGEDQ
jgi:hypothetical protein